MDFGASQPYDDAFIDMYKRLLLSAVDGRKEDCIALSREIGYLTDNDNEVSLYTWLFCQPLRSLCDLINETRTLTPTNPPRPALLPPFTLSAPLH